MGFLTESIHIRFTKEGEDEIKYLMDNYPDEYKTKSDVIRAGVFALRRWKKKDQEIQEDKNV